MGFNRLQPAIMVRVAALTGLALVYIWIKQSLGGFALIPAMKSDGSNDTGGIFNWHPLLMALAFLVFMTEAVLAYRTWTLPREQVKAIHMALHSGAVICLSFALVAAFQSHNLKAPTPTPNLYSMHSWLGITVAGLVYLQYLGAVLTFMWPGASGEVRRTVLPVHAFAGATIYVAAVATMLTGLQEKTTFVQAFGKHVPFSTALTLPAVAGVSVLVTGVLAMYNLVFVPKSSSHARVDDEHGHVLAAAALIEEAVEP